eukprot:TRINITY_DN365_c0_g1_i11.p1 TRINITY_DN365_c0_g1~~TRINITY_DN365_c0_g1_i11.p1  ORF type:complete len:638 (+),score=129.18 TRINITY_DN365_c0_g1_i11:148-2061(+)
MSNEDLVQIVSIPQAKQFDSCYIFGVTKGKQEPKIFYFDPQYGEFVTKSTPEGMPLFLYMSAVQISTDEIYLTGGLPAIGSTVTSKVTLYHPESNTYKVLPHMLLPRFAHMSAMLNGKLYVMGGRVLGDDKVALMDNVEFLDLQTLRWQRGPSMNRRRTSGTAIVYNGHLHVFGGYTSSCKRSRLIERLNEKDKVWEKLHFKLLFGVEAALLLPNPTNSGEFLLLGGCDNGGAVSHVVKYNFGTQKAVRMPNMKEARIFCKGTVYDDNLYIFGGEWSLPFETASLGDMKWEEKPITFEHILPPSQEVHAFTLAVPSYSFRMDIEEPEEPFVRCPNYSLLFGDDSDPRILEFNMTNHHISNLPLPLNLELLSYQGGVRISSNKFFIAGGLNLRSKMIVSKNAYLYNPRKGKCKVLPKMNVSRYAFCTAKVGHHIYVMGGRTAGDDTTAILSRCERFNLNEKKWEELPPLNIPRVSAISFVIKDRVFVAGGFVSPAHGHTDAIEVFNEAEARWKVIGLQLREPIEAACTFPLENENAVMIFGGKSSRESQYMWKLSFTERMDSATISMLPPILRPGFLLKSARYNENTMMILGGESKANFIQFYNFQDNKAVALPAKIDFQSEILRHCSSFQTRGALLL